MAHLVSGPIVNTLGVMQALRRGSSRGVIQDRRHALCPIWGRPLIVVLVWDLYPQILRKGLYKNLLSSSLTVSVFILGSIGLQEIRQNI